MTNRRQFITGLLASGLLPGPTWADAGSPAFLSAARRADGRFVLCGISRSRNVLFELPLPARGHAATAHPVRPEAVAFARRPGTYAVVVDCLSGHAKAQLTAPEGRHFYGHGVFSQDGMWLFTTENDFENGQGRVGVWDATRGYARVADFASGGIGPHDIKRLPGTDVLVVANGGIDTHPDSGRTKLNIATMAPNLSYIADQKVVETRALDTEMHKNSIRHLAVSPDGTVAFGMQWQGDGPAPSLVGLHKRGGDIALITPPAEALRRMQGYVGSISFARNGQSLLVTSPRGGVVQVFAAQTGVLDRQIDLEDACGVAGAADGAVISSGTGQLCEFGRDQAVTQTALAWDNHLIPVGV